MASRTIPTSFGAALIGGLVVGIVGWIAIAAGWVESRQQRQRGSALAATPLPEPAAQQSQRQGLTVNQIYQHGLPRSRLHPGTAGAEGLVAVQPVRR